MRLAGGTVVTREGIDFGRVVLRSAAMTENPLVRLATHGQSIWLDFLRRGMITSGELQRLIDEDGLRGITSNPAIFEKAIAGSDNYDEDIRAFAREGKSVEEIYRRLTVEDIQNTCDLFRPLFESTGGGDGYVSLEVSPHLAHDTEGTVEEARSLWAAVSRPNVMIKVPGTQAGLPAIQRLIADGINVNVTLLFGLQRYRAVGDVYMAGLEERLSDSKSVDGVASVASFFLSRIDTMVDPMLEERARAGGPHATLAEQLRGKAAIASAKIAYQIYGEIFGSDRFRTLEELGARPQRLLWASTSTKNPAYSDTMYVEPLIGPNTVNTMPMETLEAYRDHGDPAPRLQEGVKEAETALAELEQVGIDLDEVTQRLEDEGVQKFIAPYDSLMNTMEAKQAEVLDAAPGRGDSRLGGHERAVRNGLDQLDKDQFAERLWSKDPSLWASDAQAQKGIASSLGWLGAPRKMAAAIEELAAFARELRSEGFQYVVHMGMGGSSLAPLVFERVLGVGGRGLPLKVLDTTDPATVLEIEGSITLSNTLFIVASKSGTTAEPSAFGDYFYDRVRQIKGELAGDNFVAITDPGSQLAEQAKERDYRRTFLNSPDVGGRYSALTYFGLVPAALLGADLHALLARAGRMAEACGPAVAARDNPGVALGAAIGEAARQGRDKLTFLMPPALETLGLWLEQLIAESTGKEGTGIIPVVGEPVMNASAYGDDRLFVEFRLKGEDEGDAGRLASALRETGHPVITIALDDRLDIGQEFFRWEVATAAAGAVLGINPFDQPNVQESKDNTNRLLGVVEQQGRLPAPQPAVSGDHLSLHGSTSSAEVSDALGEFLGQARPGDYLAILAYLPEGPATGERLRQMRAILLERYRFATTVGYGPRYLHSTGQLHKGGPSTGIFLLITGNNDEDAPLPGRTYGFGVFQHAQALGDMEALREHDRRVLRVHLDAKPVDGLEELRASLEKVVARQR
jgi:transaldolase / glucose-6-phosphate isomerase